MDSTSIYREWLTLSSELLKNPRKNLKKLSYILRRSQKFLSIISSSGVSTSYSSYADSLKESIETILKVLIEHVEQEDSHAGIYYILSSYRDSSKQSILPVVSLFLRGNRSAFLLRSVEKICEKTELFLQVEEYTADILQSAASAANDSDYVVGENSVRIIFSLYKQKRSRIFLSEITKSFQMRYLDLFLSKIFPEIIEQENTEFITLLIGLLSQIKEIPILTITQNIRREKLLQIPRPFLRRLLDPLRDEKKPQEYIGGITTASKLPEIFNINEILLLLLECNNPELLYKQGDTLIEYITTAIQSKSPIQIEETDNTVRVLSNFENLEGCSEYKITVLNLENAEKFLQKLFQYSDGTRIQFCRILFHLKLSSQNDKIVSLLKNKNIRVKWNALRALSVYSLQQEQVKILLNLLASTENEKIKLWTLKTLEPVKNEIKPVTVAVKNTPYKEEIEELLERINN